MTNPTADRHPIFTRRNLFGATAAGLAATSLGACATSGGDDDAEEVTVGGDAENPFEVDGSAPLDVVIFDGGFGNEYALAHQEIYNRSFPDAEIEHLATQAIAETQQPRFAEGKPCDVLDNSGAQQIPMDSLVSDGELAELTPLLDAPSYDDPEVTVRDTLRDGVLSMGTFNGKVYALNYVFSAWTVWYDAKLFRDKGWTPPETWEEMLALCPTIQAEGIAPWTYAGQHPVYLYDLFLILAGRHGGVDVVKAIDHLEPDAWRHESVVKAAEALAGLHTAGYILEGTPGIDHIQSQTAFNERRAAFLPCGSWLPNEQKGIAPDDFEYAPIGVPYLEGSVQPGLISAGGEEPFVIPKNASNLAGAYEYLRIMLSQEGAQVFGDTVQAATVVKGVELDNPAAKMTDALVSNPDDLFQPRFRFWYTKMNEEVRPALGALLSGDATPEEFIDRMQTAADETAADDTIEKFRHED
ncbi:N-acetylglucosamine/diacetylchitobiose ABC transporter substrate-binding protein [Glycomyces sp. TRM65418]|uniref:N-acetylglucosamine/diacetylchitobiose ABC transporter substrate-binding protein n=1 Tax=Glycomyces sp. TRM65418 TaxID=2867006 RepID=UPI001CE59F00|nr:N-acetylglucosamine/diacetylchitobiose ABC transporter substrate-binding protein [Glycomyces sp. TRM65418]MCC3765657.1 N-acetylglucosamine/diacetylchitobiose ABC transporter substrate-binding protein [Glycomyces sp. TRM65418]QZD55254.1 N-acetylglucosamine/diacetylchitobiose ABC transporter substrate-binding protein [Glycomyces sp. TRM65418]